MVVVEGEEAMLISNLSSFSHIDAEEAIGTQFQALTLEDKRMKGPSIYSFRDAQEVVRSGETGGWGSVLSLPDNRDRTGLGFSSSSFRTRATRSEFEAGFQECRICQPISTRCECHLG